MRMLMLLTLFLTAPAFAQQSGGTLRIMHRDSPASLSIHEEGTNSVSTPMNSVFNNLVIYDQHKPQNSMATIVPELATSWSWNEAHTELTFKLREGVRWHDGKPFTAADVKCTWDMLSGHSETKFRVNFREGWYKNLASVTTEGDFQATFHLTRPQPALIALLASGYSPVYPCHVPPNTMRTKPIGRPFFQ